MADGNICLHCKRVVRSAKAFHPRKSLCMHCYDAEYELVPCMDCFQDVERKRTEKNFSLCTSCKGHRKTQNDRERYCLRNNFSCSHCASVHSLRCPLKHYTDMNLPPNVIHERNEAIRLYLPSDAQDGFYFWHRFLFCSRACVRKRFGSTPFCAVCGESGDSRCARCSIPVCVSCAKRWLFKDLCMQCFIDSHPTWTRQQLHTQMVNMRQNFKPTNRQLDRNVQWAIAESKPVRY